MWNDPSEHEAVSASDEQNKAGHQELDDALRQRLFDARRTRSTSQGGGLFFELADNRGKIRQGDKIFSGQQICAGLTELKETESNIVSDGATDQRDGPINGISEGESVDSLNELWDGAEHLNNLGSL